MALGVSAQLLPGAVAAIHLHSACSALASELHGRLWERNVKKEKRRGRDGGGSCAWIVCLKAQMAKEEKCFRAGNVGMETKHDSYT